MSMPTFHRKPLIGLLGRAHRAMRADMLGEAHRRGYSFIRQAHNDVFATLPLGGARASDMAARAGITRQSMGEIVRELVELDLLEMQPDPSDGRAKVVTFTARGREFTRGGLEHIVDVERRLADEFGEEDLETTRRVLEGVVRILDDDPAAG